MAQAREGDTVLVHFTGKFEDGTVFDSSAGNGPLRFTIGSGKVAPGFEEAVVGMRPGEMKTVRVPAAKAYGPHLESLVQEVSRDKIPPHIRLEPGLRLRIDRPDGSLLVATVLDISHTRVLLDGNHPLAGRDLMFDIRLLEIV